MRYLAEHSQAHPPAFLPTMCGFGSLHTVAHRLKYDSTWRTNIGVARLSVTRGIAKQTHGAMNRRDTGIEVRVMRRHAGKWMFAGLLGLLSLPGTTAASPDDVREPAAVAQAVAVQRVSVPAIGIRDEAAMVLVGTALIGLAAAVRRAA